MARRFRLYAWALIAIGLAAPAPAEDLHARKIHADKGRADHLGPRILRVAVVYSFVGPAREIAAAFHESTGHEAVLINGASGALMDQIVNGAPFDVFLSADAARPKAAVALGLAAPGRRFTYAMGPLVLWSRSLDVSDGEAALRNGAVQRLAIADPIHAPYGRAALETVQALGLFEQMKTKLVLGDTVSQVFNFVDGGGADAGFIAAAQLRGVSGGASWVVPEKIHPLIRQDAVLLKRGAKNPAAVAFMVFLKGPRAREIIKSYGYSAP